jgi:hypothetical protein
VRAKAHVLDIPFEARPLAQMHGAPWNPAVKAFVFHGEHLPEALAPYASQPHSWERLKQDGLNGLEPSVSEPERHVVLRPHQGEAVSALLAAYEANRCGFLVADDVGLGKTMESWAGVLRMESIATVLVVCPIAVVAHWRRTIAWMGNGGKQVVVTNYERYPE